MRIIKRVGWFLIHYICMTSKDGTHSCFRNVVREFTSHIVQEAQSQQKKTIALSLPPPQEIPAYTLNVFWCIWLPWLHLASIAIHLGTVMPSPKGFSSHEFSAHARLNARWTRNRWLPLTVRSPERGHLFLNDSRSMTTPLTREMTQTKHYVSLLCANT